jgi:hypothetical protein
LRPTELYLLSAVAEPKARRIVAEANAIPSGTIPVLAAIGFGYDEWGGLRAREIYEAKLGTETLIRQYIAVLVKAQLVERYTRYRITRLRLTVEGLQAVKLYERELQQGVIAFGQVRPVRVLTRPLVTH